MSPDQARAAAMLPAVEADAEAARTYLAAIQLQAAMACVTARLVGLPDPEHSRAIISNLPTGETQ